MEARKNIQSESNQQNVVKELKDRLAQIQEQRKNLAQEKIELFKKIKEQRDKLDKQIEQLMAPVKNKPQEYKKSMDDAMRKRVYFYDYLPRTLSIIQINFSSQKEELIRELSEIQKSAENFVTKMGHEQELFEKMSKNLDELEKKPAQIEMELINEENQIVQKLYEIQTNSLRFFQPSASSNDKVEKKACSESHDEECKQKMGC